MEQAIAANEVEVVAFRGQFHQALGRQCDLEVVGHIPVTARVIDELGTNRIRNVRHQETPDRGFERRQASSVRADTAVTAAGHRIENLTALEHCTEGAPVDGGLGTSRLLSRVEVGSAQHALLTGKQRASDDDVRRARTSGGNANPSIGRRTDLLVAREVRPEEHFDLIVEAKAKEVDKVTSLRRSGRRIERLQIERWLDYDCSMELPDDAVPNDLELERRGREREHEGWHRESNLAVAHQCDRALRHGHVANEDVQRSCVGPEVSSSNDRGLGSVGVEVGCDVVPEHGHDAGSLPRNDRVALLHRLKQGTALEVDECSPERDGKPAGVAGAFGHDDIDVAAHQSVHRVDLVLVGG